MNLADKITTLNDNVKRIKEAKTLLRLLENETANMVTSLTAVEFEEIQHKRWVGHHDVVNLPYITFKDGKASMTEPNWFAKI